MSQKQSSVAVELEDLPESLADAIAIVGLAGRFPGADDISTYWSNLREGVESVRFWTPEELEDAGVPPLLARDPGYVPALGALSDIAGFDAGFFGLNPRVATTMDPQQRLFLECCWHALEDAAVDASRFDGPIAVYGGASLNSYLLHAIGRGVDFISAVGDLQAAIGNRTDHLAPSVAYRLGLKGPAVTVQTTCSTSLVAVHLACQALLDYQTDLAIAGGVRVQVPQEGGYVHETGGIFSPDGHCRPFDADAAGTLNGNGVGTVVLARLEDALAQGLSVRALILGSAINNDGDDKVGYTAPSVDGQAQVIALAQGIAGVTPRDISYIETHGTATPLGDPIEIAALRRVFSKDGDSGRTTLGAVKSNFGHLDTAAGIAGLIKTVLAMEARELPPTLHFQQANAALELEASGFEVSSELQSWEAPSAGGRELPRRAGVSSFGIGGTNAHLVLEEAPEILRGRSGGESREWQMLLLSARSSAALEDATQRFAAFLAQSLEQRGEASAEVDAEQERRELADIAYTLKAGRRAFEFRRAVLCRSLEEAVQHFQSLDPRHVFTSLREPRKRPLVFLLPGQGSQHPGMLAELYRNEAETRRWLDRGAEVLAALPEDQGGCRDLLERIFDGDAEALRRTDLAQPALFVVEYALARQWMEWGVAPSALLGHSIGEYVAAALAEVFTFEQGLRLVARRGQLVQSLPGGSMVSVHADENRLQELLATLRREGHTLDLAAINRPGVGVVAGSEEATAALRQRLEEEGWIHRALHTSHAFHSAMMEPAQEGFRRAFEGIELQAPKIPFVSNVSGEWILDEEATSPDYWVRHLRATVRFSQGLEQVLEESSAVLLEVGPNTHLATLARQHPARGADHVVLSSQRHAREEAADVEALLTAAARLWLAGVPLHWETFYAQQQRLRRSLPGYPFEHRRYWIEAGAAAPGFGATAGAVAPGGRAADPAHWFYLPAWRRAPLSGEGALPASVLLLTAEEDSPSSRLGQALEERLRAAGAEVRRQALVLQPAEGGSEGLPAGERRTYESLLAESSDLDTIVSLLAVSGDETRHEAAAEGMQRYAFDAHFLLLQALAEGALGGEGDSVPRLEVVTDGAQEVLGSELRWPEKALVQGPVRVGPKEIPGLVTRAVDLEPGLTPEEFDSAADRLLAEWRQPEAAGAIVAWRGDRRWQESFESAPLAPPAASSTTDSGDSLSPAVPKGLRPGGVVLLTGGFGGMGRTFAAELIRQAQARIVLVGRREPSTTPAYGEVVAELEALGGEVLALQGDIGSPGAWESLLDAVEERFGALHGVVHAAGVPPTSPLMFKTLEEAREALGAKVAGTLDLDAAIARRPWAADLDFVLLCSSRAAFLAPPASVDYTSANAFLDAFALHRAAAEPAGPAVLAVNWCGWRDVGMLAAAAQSGDGPVDPAVGRPEPVDYPFFDRRFTAAATASRPAVHTFELEVSPRTHWLLDDHRIGGHAVVAGTTYLELARAAAVELGLEGPMDLVDVFFLTPVRLRDEESRTLRVKLEERGDGGYDVEAASRILTEGEDRWENTVVFQLHPAEAHPEEGSAAEADAEQRAEARRARLEELRRRTSEGRSVAAVEDELREDLGPRWQNVAQVFHGDQEVLGVMELGAPYHGDLEAMRLHPSLLDRAVSLGVNYLAGDVPDEFYLPMAYRRIRVLEDLPARFLAHVRRIDTGTQEKETLSFAVTLLSEEGQVLVDIDHFSRKRVSDAWAQLRDMVAKEGGTPATAAAALPSSSASSSEDSAGSADEALRSALSPEEGADAFLRLLGALDRGRAVVSPTHLDSDRAAAAAVRAEDFATDLGDDAEEVEAHPRTLDTEYVAPSNALEEILASLWSQALGVSPVGVQDNYFELGGDSVLGVQIIARARSQGVEILPNQLFEYQTIAELAAVLAASGVEVGEGAAPAGPPLEPRAPETPLPLSLSQQRLWFLHSLDPHSPAYHLSCPLRLDGELRHRELARCLADIVTRHEALRTRFESRQGWPSQVVAPAPAGDAMPLPVVDVSGVPDPQGLADRLLEQATRRPFALEESAPFRTLLVRVAAETAESNEGAAVESVRGHHLAIFVLHHIIADGWSIGVLVGELGALYRARLAGESTPVAALPALPVQYGDYTLWQQRRAAEGAFDADVDWWREALADMPPRLELPADGPAPRAGEDASSPQGEDQDSASDDRGVTLDLRYPEPLARALEALARSCDTTLFTVALAAFDALAARLAGQDKVVVGVPVANRERAEIADLIGLFINTLPIPLDLGGDPSFRELVARAKRSSLDAFSHQEAPLEKVAEAVRADGGGREGLFSVLFGFQNAPMETLQLPGLELSTPAADRGTAMFDWTLVFYETSAALTGWIAYRAQRFDAATMARFEARFGALLTAVAQNPELPLSRLPVMAEEERRQLLAAAGDGLPVGSAAEASSLIHRFAEQAAANPQGIAVSSSQGAWTYGQLAILAAGGAAALRSAGVGPGRRVALAYEPGLEAVAAQLATLAAGASYLPLDPSQPHSRVANIVADGAPSLILVGPGVASPTGLAAPSRAHQEVFAEAAERAQLDGVVGGAAVNGALEALGAVAVGPEHPAYLLFTSGSTGRPKGVMVPHGAVLSLLGSCEDWLAPSAEDRWSVFHSLAFDFSVWEIWGALAFGGRAVMVSRDVARSPALFLDLLESEGVSVLSQTPGAFRRLDSADAERGDDAPALTALRAITFGGEALDPGQLRAWRSRRPAVELINLYGITETTVHVTRHTLGETDLRLDGRSPIGEALGHLSLHVVDTHPGAAQEPAPAGAVGELVVGGAGLAQGYAGDPARTAERFVPDPHAGSRRPGARLYRSGDLGRRRADGGVDYLGRRDRQLKVRGYRIEAGEVEAAAAAHPGLAVAVADVATVAGESSLVVWATAAPASENVAADAPDLAALRQEMAQRVPEYMLPSRLVMLESLPLTSSGKIDRRALPHPESAAAHGTAPSAAPTREPADALELYLAELYAEVLDIPRPGVTEAFFDLGGHSVAAAVLVNRIQQRLGAIVHVVAIFDAPTVESLAEYLRQRHPQAVAQHFGEGGEGSATAALRSAASPVDEAALDRLAALVPPLAPMAGGERRGKNPPAVFVLAPPRSGTTLLRVMLAGHPQLFAPPELELLSFPDLASRRAAFDNERDRFWLEGLVRAGMEALDTDAAGAEAWVESLEARDASTAEAYGALQELLTAPAGRRLLVDKTPSYALHPSILQRAEEIFDGAYFIHLLRHPQGMVRSFDDAGLDEIFFRFDHGLPRRALAEGLWTLSQRNILDFLQGIPEERHTAVSFEELVRSPVETMERLCAFLDLPFEAAMADPYGANSSARMTDGPRPESRMLGDVKLLEHRGIDPAVADRWRQDERLAPLSAATAKTAAGLGYVDLGVDPVPASASGDSGSSLISLAAGAPSSVQSGAQRWPLAPAQERLWFLHQLAPESPAYNVPASMTLTGALDVSALAWALERVEERHGALRTVFDHDVEGFPGPSQRVRPPREGGRFALPVVDLSALAPQRAEGEARRLASSEALAPFDLATGPMLRARLLRLPPQGGIQNHGALLTVHHAVADGWSLRLLVADFGELYASRVEGREARLQPLPVSYGAYAAHLRKELESGSLVAALERRVEALRGTPVLELATDRPRPRVASSEGSRIPLHWPAALVESAAAFGRRRGATPFMVILAAYSALLGRLSRQRDFAVGVPEAGRLHQEVEGVVGLFVNILAMRLDLGAAAGAASPSFEDLLERVRGASRDAFEDREVPLEQIVEVIQPQRDPSREPLCQVALAYQNLPSGELQLPNLEVGTLETGTAAAKFDLLLTLSELPGEGAEGILEGALDWRTDLFDAATAERIAAQLQRLLERALESPQRPVLELPLSEASEVQHLLTYEGAVPSSPGDAREPAESALEMVAQRVAESPEGLAVDGDFGRLTYAELWRRVEARACALRAAGIGAGSRVAVLAAGTPEMLEGQLAVLAAGAAYVPLDPRHPAERLAAVAVAALVPPRSAGRPVALLAGGHGVSSELRRAVAQDLEKGLAGAPGATPWTVDLETAAPAPSEGELRSLRSLPRPHPLQEAYLIFTSGSTGTPKATVMTQRNLARFVATQGPVFGIGAGRRMLQMASPAFDAAVMEVFVPLVEGSTVVLGRRETLAAGPDLEQALQRLAVDVLFITPSVLALLDSAALPDLAVVLCGGEACPAPLAARWSRGRRWVHVYGPTECTIITLGHPFALDSEHDAVADASVAPPLGRGLPGVEVLLLDDALLPAPPGAVAEIALAGAVLSRGYEGRPALTAETFVPHPHPQRPGQRLYRTGDLARLAGDDTLRFHGRRDRQVQVRGVRVEPGEVEAAVVRLPGVRDAAVEGYGEGSNFRLAAWVVPEGSLDDAHRELAAWRETLRQELPEVLVPDAFVLMESLPRGTSGKVDRSQLPQPVAGAGSGEAVAPRSEREVQVAAVWRELLEVETVGVETPFFDLGGHSLLATRVVSRLREASGLALTLRDFFDAPTVAGLALRLEELAQDGGAESVEAAETAIPVAQRGDQDLESLLDELGAVAALPDGGGEEGSGE